MLTRRSLFAGAAVLGFPTFAEAKPKKRDRVLLVAGQSAAFPWGEAYVREEFLNERRKMGDRSEWTFVMAAVGGSSALQEFHNIGRWWVDVDDQRKGPSLKWALSVVDGLANKPTDILWIQGQREGDAYTVKPRDMGRHEFKDRYKKAVFLVSRALRRRCAGKAWKSVPFYVQTVGRRDYADIIGDQLVREAQMELISERRKWGIRAGAIQPLDLPLKDYVHPTIQGNKELARRTARALD